MGYRVRGVVVALSAAAMIAGCQGGSSRAEQEEAAAAAAAGPWWENMLGSVDEAARPAEELPIGQSQPEAP
jgi:hypothetical protein